MYTLSDCEIMSFDLISTNWKQAWVTKKCEEGMIVHCIEPDNEKLVLCTLPNFSFSYDSKKWTITNANVTMMKSILPSKSTYQAMEKCVWTTRKEGPDPQKIDSMLEYVTTTTRKTIKWEENNTATKREREWYTSTKSKTLLSTIIKKQCMKIG